jgi:hypothetical protein
MEKKNAEADAADGEQKKPKASWPADRVKSLFEIMKEHNKTGDFTDNNYTTQSLTQITKKFNEETGLNYTREQISSIIADKKKAWKEYNRCKMNSGFGFCPIKKVTTAPDKSWDDWLKVNPTHKTYRHNEFLNYELMTDLFDGKVATGKYAKCSSSVKSESSSISTSTPSASATRTGTSTPTASFTPTNLKNDSESDGENTNSKRPRKQAIKDEKVNLLMDGIASLQKDYLTKQSFLEKATNIFNIENATLDPRQKLGLKKLFQDEKVAEMYFFLSKVEREIWVEDELER